MKTWRAAVIGLGLIGMEYDYQSGNDEQILTHAAAFNLHPSYRLVGAVDPDKRQRKRFENKYQVPAFNSSSELFLNTRPDVVAIAVPTKYHVAVFEEIIKYDLSAIISEKPIADNMRDAKKMTDYMRATKHPVIINYMRRFDPGVNKLKQMIKQKTIGEIYKGIVWYSKGLANNGSHYIDLLIWLLGEVNGIKIINKGRSWGGTDPEPDVLYRFGKTEVAFLAGREECFSIVEMELIGTKGKLLYRQGGQKIEYFSCQLDPLFPNYVVLSNRARVIKSELMRVQWHVLQHLKEYLSGKRKMLNSDAFTATKTLSVLEATRTKLKGAADHG